MLIYVFCVILQTSMTNMTNKLFLPIVIGTGFGSGYWPWGPGTAGSFLALLIWLFICLFNVNVFVITLSLAIVFTILGTWATARLMPIWGNDPSRVVVDEMVGTWIALLACPTGSLGYGFAAFALFRFFDILKPLGIRRLDNKVGAFWVMADDILAGVYALIVLIIVRWLI